MATSISYRQKFYSRMTVSQQKENTLYSHSIEHHNLWGLMEFHQGPQTILLMHLVFHRQCCDMTRHPKC